MKIPKFGKPKKGFEKRRNFEYHNYSANVNLSFDLRTDDKSELVPFLELMKMGIEEIEEEIQKLNKKEV